MRKIQSEDLSLEMVHPDAASIDIGNESHSVAVPPKRDSQTVDSPIAIGEAPYSLVAALA